MNLKTMNFFSPHDLINEACTIVLQRSYGYVYICLFVNVEIKQFGWYIHYSGVGLKNYLLSAWIAQ